MNFSNAFGIENDVLSDEDKGLIVDNLATYIVKRGLSVPAILALDMHKAVAYTAGQCVTVLTPVLGPLFGLHRMEQAKRLLTSKDGIECLIQRIEELTVEQGLASKNATTEKVSN